MSAAYADEKQEKALGNAHEYDTDAASSEGTLTALIAEGEISCKPTRITVAAVADLD